MKKLQYATFETGIGVCGIAWSEPHDTRAACAVALFQLPEASEALTKAIEVERSQSPESISPTFRRSTTSVTYSRNGRFAA